MYTGLHSSAVCALAETLSTLNLRYYYGSRVALASVSMEDQVFLTLVLSNCDSTPHYLI